VGRKPKNQTVTVITELNYALQHYKGSIGLAFVIVTVITELNYALQPLQKNFIVMPPDRRVKRLEKCARLLQFRLFCKN